MKRLLLALVAASLCACARAASTDTIAAAEQKTVEIHMTKITPPAVDEKGHKPNKGIPVLYSAVCSGAFADDQGDILTARHCVDGFDTFQVQTHDGRLFVATVVSTSPAHDLALIHIDLLNTPYFALAKRAERGERISVLGSPLAITDTLSTGVIARLDGDVTLLDCGVLPGNSGGPVFNENGELVGVVNAGFIVLFGMTHLNMAQSLDAVTFFLKKALAEARK